MLEKAFGEKIRELRLSRRWSQEDLAEAMTTTGTRLHQTQIGRIEIGARPVRLNEAGAFADLFGVSLAALLDGGAEPVRDLYADGWKAGYRSASDAVLAALGNGEVPE